MSGKTFATVVRNQPVQSQPAKTPPPSYGSNPFKQVVNRTRDVFDANTPQDYARRSRYVQWVFLPKATKNNKEPI